MLSHTIVEPKITAPASPGYKTRSSAKSSPKQKEEEEEVVVVVQPNLLKSLRLYEKNVQDEE